MLTLTAHYDGIAIRLDEPFDLPVNARLLVTVLPSAELNERVAWTALAYKSLARAYDDEEPDYSDARLID